jgi:hypothetical protein
MTTPDCRTLTIEVEGTGSEAIFGTQYFAYTWWGDSYWGNVWWGGNKVTGTPALRTLTIEAENRTLAIEACKDGG